MSAHVILNLLKRLGKRDKMRGLQMRFLINFNGMQEKNITFLLLYY